MVHTKINVIKIKSHINYKLLFSIDLAPFTTVLHISKIGNGVHFNTRTNSLSFKRNKEIQKITTNDIFVVDYDPNKEFNYIIFPDLTKKDCHFRLHLAHTTGIQLLAGELNSEIEKLNEVYQTLGLFGDTQEDFTLELNGVTYIHGVPKAGKQFRVTDPDALSHTLCYLVDDIPTKFLHSGCIHLFFDCEIPKIDPDFMVVYEGRQRWNSGAYLFTLIHIEKLMPSNLTVRALTNQAELDPTLKVEVCAEEFIAHIEDWSRYIHTNCFGYTAVVLPNDGTVIKRGSPTKENLRWLQTVARKRFIGHSKEIQYNENIDQFISQEFERLKKGKGKNAK